MSEEITCPSKMKGTTRSMKGHEERDRTTIRRGPLTGVWPVKFVAGDWDKEPDGNVIESVILTLIFLKFINRGERRKKWNL